MWFRPGTAGCECRCLQICIFSCECKSGGWTLTAPWILGTRSASYTSPWPSATQTTKGRDCFILRFKILTIWPIYFRPSFLRCQPPPNSRYPTGAAPQGITSPVISQCNVLLAVGTVWVVVTGSLGDSIKGRAHGHNFEDRVGTWHPEVSEFSV